MTYINNRCPPADRRLVSAFYGTFYTQDLYFSNFAVSMTSVSKLLQNMSGLQLHPSLILLLTNITAMFCVKIVYFQINE